MRQFTKDHPGFVLTALAIAVSGIGILHEIVLLLAFGLNYFEYADVSDFLVAAGKTFVLLATRPEFIRPLIVIGLGITVAVVFIIFQAFISYFISKSRGIGISGTKIEQKSRIMNLLFDSFFVKHLSIFVFVFIGAIYLDILNLAANAAQDSAARIKVGKADKVVVELRRPERTMPGKWSGQNLHAITGTNQYLFYYERSELGINDKEPPNERVYVVPTSNLAQQVVIERYVTQPSDNAPYWGLF